MAVNNSGDDREKNVDFANSLLETEIAQRNARKDAQENTARWIVLTIVGLMTLLLTLSGEGDVLNDEASWLSHALFVATLAAGGVTVGCAGGTLWPRKYERLGEGGLDQFNKAEFLNQEPHAVMGRVVATRIQIAKKMDELHEQKAKWLKRAFAALAATLVLAVAQGVVLGFEPSTDSSCHQRVVRKISKARQNRWTAVLESRIPRSCPPTASQLAELLRTPPSP
jgi:hypothetical protein